MDNPVLRANKCQKNNFIRKIWKRKQSFNCERRNLRSRGTQEKCERGFLCSWQKTVNAEAHSRELLFRVSALKKRALQGERKYFWEVYFSPGEGRKDRSSLWKCQRDEISARTRRDVCCWQDLAEIMAKWKQLIYWSYWLMINFKSGIFRTTFFFLSEFEGERKTGVISKERLAFLCNITGPWLGRKLTSLSHDLKMRPFFSLVSYFSVYGGE